MGTTADKLNHLLATKDEIRAALISRGQEVPDGTPFSAYADKVRAISGGGGGSVTLGQLPEGSVIFLKENGIDTPFYVAKHNYESELNGEGRTLLVRKHLDGKNFLDDAESSVHGFSEIDMAIWLNSTYKNRFDTTVQSEMGTTTFRTYKLGSNWEPYESSESLSVFLFTMWNVTDGNPDMLPILEELKFPIFDDAVVRNQWTSTLSQKDRAYVFSNTSGIQSVSITQLNAFRPCFTLPADYVPYS